MEATEERRKRLKALKDEAQRPMIDDVQRAAEAILSNPFAVNAPTQAGTTSTDFTFYSDPLAGFKPGAGARQGSGSTLAFPPNPASYPDRGAHLRPPAGFQAPHEPPGQFIPLGYPPSHFPPGPPVMRPPAPGRSSHSGHASGSGYSRGFSPGTPMHRQTGAGGRSGMGGHGLRPSPHQAGSFGGQSGRGGRGGHNSESLVHPSMWADPWKELREAAAKKMDKGKSAAQSQQLAANVKSSHFDNKGPNSLSDILSNALKDAEGHQGILSDEGEKDRPWH